MTLRRPFNYLARKLLYRWIRPDVVRSPALDHLPANAAIVYVLDARSWSNLLVLEEECGKQGLPMPLARLDEGLRLAEARPLRRWHRVYTIAPRQPLQAWLKNEKKRSRMLAGLLDAVAGSQQLDVLLTPVSIFWGRPVARKRHWLTLLFSETWGIAGRTRRFFSILFNGRDMLVQFAEPLSLREFAAAHPGAGDDRLDALQETLEQTFTEIKTATLGPDMSHRRTLIRQLLQRDSVQAAMQRYQRDHGEDRYRVARRAERYLTEIVANCSYITIQLMQRVLTAFWHRFYSGIDVFHADRLARIARDHSLVYVPCHRSHIDYLLLSYIIHAEGLAIPYIAAGKNLNMPVIGPILRRGGAFFIRRSFKGNYLYSSLLFEYLATLVSEGMPVEYFVEGGRSRTGRLLQAKPGMLAMTVRAFLKYRKRPVAFIPVYIGYEKMIEGQAYLAELQGDDKKSETLFDSIRAILRLRGNYGRVSASFGEPVYLTDILDQADDNWHRPYDDDKRPGWLVDAVNATATRIMQGINHCCHVNAINLLATALLASPNQTLDESDLTALLGIYKSLIREGGFGANVTLTDLDPAAQIRRGEELKLIQRHKHALGDVIRLDAHTAVLLTYYRNNTLHLLALPSLLACCFTNHSAMGREKIIRLVRIVWPFLGSELFLPWRGEALQAQCDHLLGQLAQLGLLQYSEDSAIYARPRIAAGDAMHIMHLSRIISPVLELYYIIFAILAFRNDGSLKREQLEQQCQLMAQRISLLHEVHSPDFFDKKLISNFIDRLLAHDYVQLDDRQSLIIQPRAIEQGRKARHLLDRKLQHTILQTLRKAGAPPARQTDTH